MRVGLLITSIGNFGKNGYYNAQEIGLAKELDKLVDEVIIYKLVTKTQKDSVKQIQKCRHVVVKTISAKNYGVNGILDVKILDKTLNALVYFSDTQMCVPKVYRWAMKNNIKLFPYIGVIKSHSRNFLKRLMIDGLATRNLAVYKLCYCFAKTPAVEQELINKGIKNTSLTPVGLDSDLLKVNFKNTDKITLKHKYGFQANDKIILFVGRMTEEKEPLKMLDLISKLNYRDNRYKLLMVGTGPLKKIVADKIKDMGLSGVVSTIESIPNKDMWELYRFADCFVNLNKQEIFGMSILESMYYGCKVVAWHAPGPDFIIEDGVSGYLVNNDDEIITVIQNGKLESKNIIKRIKDNFLWGTTANKMYSIFRDEITN